MLLQNKRVPIEKGAVYTECTVCADHGGRMEVEGNCQESGQGLGKRGTGISVIKITLCMYGIVIVNHFCKI